jgi:shikimate dehydrogenase
MGLDAVYTAFDVEESRLMEVLPAMAAMGFSGANLTVPLKEAGFKGIRNLDESARMLGAVNTVEFLDNDIKGHNTDGKGFLWAAKEAFDVPVTGLSIFVLGCGGAGRAMAITCAAQQAGRVVVTDIIPERPKTTADEIGQLVPGAEVSIITAEEESMIETCRSVDMVIQATPTGMKEDDRSPLPSSAFRKDQMVFDLVYMHPETAIMKEAAAAGARCANGLNMLLYQGVLALTIWTGKEAPIDVMREVLEDRVYGSHNFKH